MLSKLNRYFAVIAILAGGVFTWSGHPVAAVRSDGADVGGRSVVYAAQVDALIHPVSAEYMTDTIDRADLEGADLIVFTLTTPGGLVDSTRVIVSRMLSASTPIVVYVGPSGARAASAGFLITIAADVAAMAPGTHIGAAHPVTGGGEKVDETMAKKAASDVAAYARTLASKRGRNVELSEAAVTESRAFTEDEALKAEPPLIDLVATDLRDLLSQLDGRVVKRFDGGEVVLRTSDARIVEIDMSMRQRILSAIAHPNIAYILMSLGVLGLTIELWNPGAIVPGVVGGISLLLAFFTFQILPVNYAGVLLILFGLTLLILEVKTTTFGLLATGGIVSLVLGSMILIDSPAPELRVSLRLIIPLVLGLSAVMLLLVRLGVSSQMQSATTGSAGMIGKIGRALTPMSPGEKGRVSTHGEIWNAIAIDEPVAEGDTVRVVGLEGLTLTVRRESDRPVSARQEKSVEASIVR
jgi:membrane-bound serine protease (ClpP class)